MQYREVVPITRQEAEASFGSGTPQEISDALLRSAYHDPDWRWVQDQCIRFARHVDSNVRALAIICFGHLARIHGRLDLDKVLPVLEELRSDREVASRVQDALDDIQMFVHK